MRTDTDIRIELGYRVPVMVTNMIQLGMCLSFDHDVSFDLINKSINALSIKKISEKGFSVHKKNKNKDLVGLEESAYLFQRMIYFYKKDYLTNLKVNPKNKFENLGWEERALCSLKYVLDLSSDELINILGCSFKEYSVMCNSIERMFLSSIGNVGHTSNKDLYKSSLASFHRYRHEFKDEVYQEIKNFIPVYSFISRDYLKLKLRLSEAVG